MIVADNEHVVRLSSAQIAIDSAIFPEGTSGAKLDVLARRALWQDGLNYMVSAACLRLLWSGFDDGVLTGHHRVCSMVPGMDSDRS